MATGYNGRKISRLSEIMGGRSAPSRPVAKSEPVSQRTAPRALGDMMSNGSNYFDSRRFRSSLRPSTNGDWVTPKGEVFEDGTFDPRTGKASRSRVLPKAKK